MRKAHACLSAVLVMGFVFIFGYVDAATTGVFAPISGSDSTDGTAQPLTTSDLSRIATSNDLRMASNKAWPGNGEYDEAKYIEFTFDPGIPVDAVISTASVTHEFRRATILAGAKLEIWDGITWHTRPLALPAVIQTDISETLDISDIFTTSAKINLVKIKFLAYRDTQATSATTSHDVISISVNHTEYSMAPTPSPEQTATPQPEASGTVTPAPTFSPEPTPVPTSALTILPISTPDSSPITTVSPAPIIYSPTPSLVTSPTSSPMPSTTPTVMEIVRPTPVAHILTAAISSPKTQKISRTPAPSTAIIYFPAPRAKPKLFFLDIWYLFTSLINMVRR